MLVAKRSKLVYLMGMGDHVFGETNLQPTSPVSLWKTGEGKSPV